MKRLRKPTATLKKISHYESQRSISPRLTSRDEVVQEARGLQEDEEGGESLLLQDGDDAVPRAPRQLEHRREPIYGRQWVHGLPPARLAEWKSEGQRNVCCRL